MHCPIKTGGLQLGGLPSLILVACSGNPFNLIAIEAAVVSPLHHGPLCYVVRNSIVYQFMDYRGGGLAPRPQLRPHRFR